MAFWDLAGRTVGQPVCHLLGGSYRRRIPLAVRLTDEGADRLAHLARELADQGFHSQIVAAAGSLPVDLQRLRAVGEALGERAELRFDGAAMYDFDAAGDLCAELENDCLQLVMDPLNTLEFHSLASLARQTTVPIAAWRAIRGPVDALACVRCGAAAFVVVDLARVGGIIPARKCAAVTEAAGISVMLGGGPSFGIGTAAMLQLAASAPALSSCNECTCLQLQRDVLVEPLEVVDGMMTVPQAPGLGVEVDRAKVERYRVI
jgi:L-alanine-DL-glutamate epimerase-like enolase superfamily enzyme